MKLNLEKSANSHFRKVSLLAIALATVTFAWAATTSYLQYDTSTKIVTVSGLTITNLVVKGTTFTPPDGSINSAALATSGVTSGTYGDSTHVGQFTVDSKGRITAAANVPVSGGTSGGGGGSTVYANGSSISDPNFQDGTKAFFSVLAGTNVTVVPTNIDNTQISSSSLTGSGLIVLGTSPTIVTPTIASFVNATHTHQNAAGGGQLAFTALISQTSAQLASLLSDETGSGLAVFGTSPTIVTPTIASFVNANHNHQDSAGGGQLTFSALSSQTSAQLASVLSDETGSGLAVFGTSPTIVTPTIASFVNATHTHQNAAGGGQLAFAALSSQTSAQLASVLSDETGTGLAVFGTSPTIVTPTIASFVNATHTHQNGAGGGQLTEAALNLSDVTTANATTSLHGFLPKLDGNSGHFLNGVGNFVAGSADGTGNWTASGTSNSTLAGIFYAYSGVFSNGFTSGDGSTVSLETYPLGGVITNASTSDGLTNYIDYYFKSNVSITTLTASKYVATDSNNKLVSVDGGVGTVTATGGSLTANAVVLGAGTTDTKVSANITTDGSAKLTLGTLDVGNTTDTTISRSSAGVIAVEGVPVANTTGSQTLQSKTIATTGAGGNNTLKIRRTLILDFDRVALTSMIANTNDFSLNTYGRVGFVGNSALTNNNFVEFSCIIPPYLDTASDLVVEYLQVKTTGTQTGALTFDIGMADVADSADADPTSFSNWIAMTSGTLTSAAANDVFTISSKTLTSWKSSITVGHRLKIRMDRNDSNTDTVNLKNMLISYVDTQ